jgi:oleandomycin transport system ATP-binding protein
MTNAVEAEGLVKRYGKTKALDGVDLTVRQGTVLGLLGPNGAGKTAAVRVLTTLVRPDAGRATVGGFDVHHDANRVRAMIGLTGQYAAVDEDLTGYENLVLIGRLLELTRQSAKSRSGELLERFELIEAARRSVKTYSGGMRRRLDLAASRVSRPEILFLDEPTTGLDPRSRGDVWQMIRDLVTDGVTVLLTTQYLDEADRLAGEIAVIDHGRVIANGTPAQLKARLAARPWTCARATRPTWRRCPRSSRPRSAPRPARTATTPVCCRYRWTTTTRSPPWSPGCTSRGSRSPSWPCVWPASTRCSWR